LKTRTIRSMLLLSIALLIMVPMILPASACAPKSTLVTGQATASNVQFTYLKSTGNPMIVRITSTLTFTGDFQGTGPATSIAFIDTSTGKLTFIEQVTFTGTIANSQPGTVNILIIGNGIIDGASQAYDVLNHGTGGLKGLNGVGNQATAAGSDTTTFTVKINFNQR
jgi:hypothetical protein